MLDVIVAGAGPAGSIAALILARSGARVLIVDRETFPRPKLCGDTLNPGALAILDDLGIGQGPSSSALALSGMLVSGPVANVLATYRDGRVGRAITREVFDAWLLDQAIAAGARFESGVTVTRALTEEAGGRPRVRGIVVRRNGAGGEIRLPALMTIAADGRRSAVARSLGLLVQPARPRRWAFGTYVGGVLNCGGYGEMHVRYGHYIGVAPIGHDLTNVCVVAAQPRLDGRTPLAFIQAHLAGDRRLRDRFADARFDAPVHVIGPLAVDARSAGVAGLLLAGDAAGFVDPMTGDGLHLAMRGAMLAATEAIGVVASGEVRGAAERLGEARRVALGPKIRFNRALRSLVGSNAGMRAAAYCGRVMPQLLRRVVAIAGDAA